MSKIDTYRSIGSFDFRLESDFPLSSASPGHFSIYFLVISLVFSFFLELTASIFSFLCLSFLRPRIVRRAENVQKSAEWTGWMGFWVRIGRATSPQKIRPETREMTHQFRFFLPREKRATRLETSATFFFNKIRNQRGVIRIQKRSNEREEVPFKGANLIFFFLDFLVSIIDFFFLPCIIFFNWKRSNCLCWFCKDKYQSWVPLW